METAPDRVSDKLPRDKPNDIDGKDDIGLISLSIAESESGFILSGLIYSRRPFLARAWYSDQTRSLTFLYKLEIKLHLKTK